MHSAEFEWNCVKIISGILDGEGMVSANTQIVMVWSCKTLQNNKGMFALIGNDKDNRYFEITYDGDMECFYVDCYDKVWNDVISVTKDKEVS